MFHPEVCEWDEFGIAHAHSFGTDAQHDYAVKEIAEQCCQL